MNSINISNLWEKIYNDANKLARPIEHIPYSVQINAWSYISEIDAGTMNRIVSAIIHELKGR